MSAASDILKLIKEKEIVCRFKIYRS